MYVGMYLIYWTPSYDNHFLCPQKMEAQQCQMDRLIMSDLVIKLDCLDHFKRKTFFRILNNILR